MIFTSEQEQFLKTTVWLVLFVVLCWPTIVTYSAAAYNWVWKPLSQNHINALYFTDLKEYLPLGEDYTIKKDTFGTYKVEYEGHIVALLKPAYNRFSAKKIYLYIATYEKTNNGLKSIGTCRDEILKSLENLLVETKEITQKRLEKKENLIEKLKLRNT